MAGIAGILSFDGTVPARELALGLSQGVACRGTDDQGIFQEGPVVLVHRRNAVMSGGSAQPLVTDRYVLLFDGRLYDHMDLARRLFPEAGQVAAGDAEVLLQAWETWGAECLERLDGAYSFVLWDRREQELILVRGSMGLRPLYYASCGGHFAFASLPPALLSLPWVSGEISPAELCEYLAFRYVHAPRTLLRDVQAVPPGVIMRVHRHGSHVKRHACHRFCAAEAVPDAGEATLEFDRRLRQAVLRRSRSGGQTGILLSGGLVSSLLAHMATSGGRALAGYHLVFEGSRVDEAAFAGRVAKLLGIEQRDVHVNTEAFAGAFDTCVRSMGVPLPDPAAIPQYLLLREIRAEQRVVLSGDGGDELLGGGHVAMLAMANQVAANSAWARLWPGRRPPLPILSNRVGKVLGGSEVFDAVGRAGILSGDVDPRPDLRQAVLAPLYRDLDTDPINAVLGIFQRGWLPEDSLARSDRMGAACGVEVRYPLLDRSVIAFVNAQPGGWKIRSRFGRPVGKLPVRKLLKDVLPRPLIDRAKTNFPSPLHHWLRADGACFLSERLDRLLANRWRLWRTEPIRIMAGAHQRGSRDAGTQLWAMIFLDAWLESLHEG